jgi:hypothetical protein
MNNRFGGRPWIKLWVNEWLDGTTRFEMTDAQRAFFTDLLAMAGRSRFPGTICAGEVDGKIIGYPLNKFQSLMSEPLDIEATFLLFVQTGKIEIEVTNETPVRLFKVILLNWERYQSEYQRQKPYRVKKLQGKLQQSDSKSDDEGNTTEVEVEVEVEVEENLKSKSKPTSDAQTTRVVPPTPDSNGHQKPTPKPEENQPQNGHGFQGQPVAPGEGRTGVSEQRKLLTPQQVHYGSVNKLILGALSIIGAAKTMGKSFRSADAREELKSWAALHGIPFGPDDISKAFDIAEEKAKVSK